MAHFPRPCHFRIDPMGLFRQILPRPPDLVYINMLMIQQVLSERVWLDRMASDDWRALTPLIYAHINPYGTFELDLNERLNLEAA